MPSAEFNNDSKIAAFYDEANLFALTSTGRKKYSQRTLECATSALRVISAVKCILLSKSSFQNKAILRSRLANARAMHRMLLPMEADALTTAPVYTFPSVSTLIRSDEVASRKVINHKLRDLLVIDYAKC